MKPIDDMDGIHGITEVVMSESEGGRMRHGNEKSILADPTGTTMSTSIDYTDIPDGIHGITEDHRSETEGGRMKHGNEKSILVDPTQPTMSTSYKVVRRVWTTTESRRAPTVQLKVNE